MQYMGIQCDNCKREERMERAVGWLQVKTYMQQPRVMADLAKPAPPDFGGTFCTPTCLVEFTERRSTEILSEPSETIREYVERKEREHGHDSPFGNHGPEPGQYL